MVTVARCLRAALRWTRLRRLSDELLLWVRSGDAVARKAPDCSRRRPIAQGNAMVSPGL